VSACRTATNRPWWALLASLALIVAACGDAGTPGAPGETPGQPAPGQPTPGDQAPETPAVAMGLDEVCAQAAEQEGRLVYWNNLAEAFDPLYEEFQAAYPGIEIETLELRPDESAQRVITEAAAGRDITPDIIYGGVDVFQPINDRGLVDTEIDWAALGVPEDWIHDTNMVRIYRVAGGLVYNTDRLTADDLPDTWEELIDERWRGRVVVDPRGRPFDQMALAWGAEQAIDYVQRLRDVVQPLVIEGGTAGMVAVAGGEADITTGGRSAETLEQQARGAPLEIKYLDVVTTLDAYHAVIADTRSPLSAQCWVAWFSTQGQELHDELEFKSNDTVPPGAPEGATLLSIDTEEDGDQVREVGQEMGRIWIGN
jgi:iron(III) transport system substrate-binding protein